MTSRWAVVAAFAMVLVACSADDSDPEPALDDTTSTSLVGTEVCASRATLADVDGDGADDVVDLRWDSDRDSAVLTVCTAVGTRYEAEPGGMAEYLETLDIQPDGRAEILAGGTTVSASIGTVYVLEDEELVPVRFGDGDELVLQEGFDPDGPSHEWSCSDAVEADTRGLEVRERVDASQWAVQTITVEGSLATLVEETTVARATTPGDIDVVPHQC